MLKEDVYPKAKQHIKFAKLQLLKGLWMSKFSFEKSTDELMDALC
jgi:hypothetical protein